MTVAIYGIPNCDTIKKARNWLDTQGIAYVFHDYKKEGAAAARLARWSEAVGWESLLNKRGTTFRKLDDDAKADLDTDRAIALMVAHPSVIKRPVAEYPGGILVGFSASDWAHTLL